MSDQALAYQPITRLAQLIQRKELSPVTLTRFYLDRIEELEPQLNAHITIMAESALAEAKAAEEEIHRGQYRGPLHGIPMGMKDQFWTKGVNTTWGSRIYRDFIPAEDATVVRRLREAGAVLIAKHNQAEFAMGGTRVHPYGTPRNPWDPQRIPGHSSSGSAVAVAAAMCAAALGEDTGGSGRIPAAACGIVAIRPTFGRISRHGTMPVSWSMDSASPMSLTVEDCAIVLQAVAGHDLLDPLSSPSLALDYRQGLHDGVRGMRAGAIKELLPPDSADQGVRQAFQESIRTLESLGMTVGEVSVPLITLAAPIFVAICDTDAAGVQFDNIRLRPMDYDSSTRTRLMSASLVSASIYTRAQRARTLFRRQMEDALRKVDILLSPMSGGPPPLIEEENVYFQSKEDVIRRQFGARSFTTPYSLAAMPAITIPCGVTANGNMPMGLQIGGGPFEEATVLRAAAAFESATQWHTRHPKL
ncbi:MAG: amidase [Chloroflexi bacterium]|nr:amidase [Chloroflexota bacterium]